MIKCIALDLDGTTLYDDRHISPRTKAAIDRAVRGGVHIVAASGRCLESLPACITKIQGIEYAITSNGAAVYNLRSGKCLRRFSMPERAVKKVMELAGTGDFAVEVFFDGKAYAENGFIGRPAAYGVSPGAVEYIRTTRHGVSDIRAFLAEHSGQIDGIDLLTADRAVYAHLRNAMEEMNEIYITSSVGHRIELSAGEAGKHTALAFLLDRLGVSRGETASFGNADNDSDMLRYAGCGIAVQNATESCRKAARWIVPDNTEDGVAIGIEWLLDGPQKTDLP